MDLPMCGRLRDTRSGQVVLAVAMPETNRL